MAWLLLVLSGLLDVAWALATKKADGYANWGWTALSLVLLGASVFTLGKALSALPLGMAYVVWTGIGAVGSVLVGTLVFQEVLDFQRMAFIAIVVVGIIGLNLSTP
ncbi:multidrug efflux SMR transporter [Mesorhizobium loti]|nr:multidrug efflux SMR transporter [Mesorhizobium loti]